MCTLNAVVTSVALHPHRTHHVQHLLVRSLQNAWCFPRGNGALSFAGTLFKQTEWAWSPSQRRTLKITSRDGLRTMGSWYVFLGFTNTQCGTTFAKESRRLNVVIFGIGGSFLHSLIWLTLLVINYGVLYIKTVLYGIVYMVMLKKTMALGYHPPSTPWSSFDEFRKIGLNTNNCAQSW